MNLPETIKTAREGLSMTQEDLAEKCEVSRQAVSKWELGASAPSPENLELLSEILGVSLEPDPDPNPAPEAEPNTDQPASAGPRKWNPWKWAALALAVLMAAALLSIWLWISVIQPDRAPTEPEPAPLEPEITGIWFYDQEGAPLEPDLGDGWKSFTVGQRVYMLVSFRQGTETGVQGVSLFATPTGTETYDQREQLALQSVYDRTCALFPLDFPEPTMYHLDVVLECGEDQRITETLNVTAVDPELRIDQAPGEALGTEGNTDLPENTPEVPAGEQDTVLYSARVRR